MENTLIHDGLIRVIVRLESALTGLEQQLAATETERDALRAQIAEPDD